MWLQCLYTNQCYKTEKHKKCIPINGMQCQLFESNNLIFRDKVSNLLIALESQYV
jgi:hypothetical protein